ncbi:cell division protein ZipA [Parahaliea mediterranea]|uniref:Cell division protein ZipA n=2 Tax=Parahaliea mediterranea TaxID=651086 RepID=A0A939DIX0_9GAMM|nr:cell division protein ZipA [Parahaliea mediterranea]
MKLVDNGKGEAEGETEGRSREAELAWLRELPNGGARVVERGEEDDEEAIEERIDAALEGASLDGESLDGGSREGEPLEGEPLEGGPLEARGGEIESVRVAREESAVPARGGRDAGSRTAASQVDASRPAATQPSDTRAVQSRDKGPARSRPAPGQPPEDDVELFTGMSSADEPENLDWLDALEAEQKKAKQAPSSRVSAQLPRDVEPEAFMLNVVARDPAGFRGEDILHILLACDLRFGDMNFFHRHEQEAGRGPIQFSVANMMQPGVFDIDNMADFSTPGLVFFVTLPGPEDMMKAFDYMLETAQAVARNLGGDVLDETRSVLTRQTLEHNRQQIRDLERRLLAKTR